MVIGRGVLCLKVLPVLFRPETDPGQQLGIAFGQMGFDLLPVGFCPVHHPGDFLLGKAPGFQLFFKAHFQVIQKPFFVFGGQQVPAAVTALVGQHLLLCGQGIVAFQNPVHALTGHLLHDGLCLGAKKPFKFQQLLHVGIRMG